MLFSTEQEASMSLECSSITAQCVYCENEKLHFCINAKVRVSNDHLKLKYFIIPTTKDYLLTSDLLNEDLNMSNSVFYHQFLVDHQPCSHSIDT